MITRRLAARRLVRHGSTEAQPLRRWLTRVVLIAVVVGAAAGSVAWLQAWPFASTQTIVRVALGSSGPNEAAADAIFQRAEPRHVTVDVYPTPPPAVAVPPAGSEAPVTEPPSGSDSESGDDGGAGGDN